MQKKYIVRLTEPERTALEQLLSSGTAAARKLTHARILLKANQTADHPGWGDTAIAEALEVSRATVERVRQRFVEEGLEVALCPRPSTAPHVTKLDGRGEARLIAEVCGPPPAGRDRWTLRLLAGRLVELSIVESISYETVRQTLKRQVLKPWQTTRWCIPPSAQCGVCLPDGRRARRVPPPLRPALPAGLLRRDQQAVGRGDSRPSARSARPAGPGRLRV
jgi:transposase